MATKKKPTAKPESAVPNREQRRREKFGKPGNVARSPDPWPESRPNPAFGQGADDQAAYTGRPEQGVTRNTGPGTGGATEGDDRVIDREGIHPSDSAKV
jgi:hypothetical protein